nr:hypothetical protein [Tanacetum cinerariifolium]
MLKKFGLEDSKPMKTPMSTKMNLMKDKEGESVDNTKYRGTTYLGLWYPKGSGIETMLEEEKARRNGKVYKWKTTTYDKIWYDENVHDLRSVETEFLAIVFNDAFTSDVTPFHEPAVSLLNDNKIDFKISFDESDDEDYTLVLLVSTASTSVSTGSIVSTVSRDDENATNPPSFPPAHQAPYTLSTIKLPILKKEGLHKGYDKFQSLMSQLEIHGAGVSIEDANQKFLRVFESNVKGSSASSSSTLNMAFVSSDSTSSTNEVRTAYGVSTSSGHNSQREGSSSYTDELILKKFYKKTRRNLHFDAKEPVGFDKTKVECFNCHNTRHFARECKSKGNQERRRRDAGNTEHKARDNGRRPTKQDEPKAMVTINGDVIQAQTLSHMSAKDKSELGYGTQIHKGVLSYENELFESVFNSRSSDVEDNPVNDRFAKVEGMHVVHPPIIGIYMPPKFDFGIDESRFTYGLKHSKNSESDAKTSDLASCESNSSVETLESVPKPVKSKPKAVSKLKVWSDASIIEEYKSDSDDEYMFKAIVEQELPSCAFINTVKHVKSPRQTVKDQYTCSQNPKVDKRDWTGLMSKRLGLGYGYTRKACFVCGSFSHLIRDCDFHEKRIAKHVALNKSKNKDNPHQTLKRKGIVDSGCSRHMTGNKAYLVEYQDFNSGPVSFRGNKGQITGKGKIRTGKLDFEDVYFVK